MMEYVEVAGMLVEEKDYMLWLAECEEAYAEEVELWGDEADDKEDFFDCYLHGKVWSDD